MLAEQLRGTLPPGGLGVGLLNEIVSECQPLVDRHGRAARRRPPRTLDVDIDLGDGRRLTGTVAGVYGNRLVSLGYSRLKAKHRLRTWVDAARARAPADPDEHWTAHAIGRERAGPKRALVRPLDHRAVDWLRDLVDLRDRGLREPLPVPIETGRARGPRSTPAR